MKPINTDIQSDKKDCTVRATAHALAIPYHEAYCKLQAVGRKQGQGIHFKSVAERLGFEAMPELSCRALKTILPELQSGRYVVRVTRHVFAVVDGQVLDKRENRPGSRVKMVYKLV
jgi:hypothetical protein